MAALCSVNDKYDMYAAIGIVPGKQINKDDFLNSVAALAIAEKARKEKGEEMLPQKVNNTWYDVVNMMAAWQWTSWKLSLGE